MNAALPMAALAAQESANESERASAGWVASLDLEFERRALKTVVAKREHIGPLRLLKPLYPEGEAVCHAIIVHPPGGIVAGDQLQTSLTLHERAHALATTPGAQKWYRAASMAREPARAHTTLKVGERSILEWLPQETILFDGVHAEQSLRIELQPTAHFFGWEMLCVGRSAQSERLKTGQFKQRIEIVRDGAPIWSERMLLSGNDPLLDSVLGFNGMPVVATAWLHAPEPSVCASCFESVRGALAAEIHCGASRVTDELVVIKLVCASVEVARNSLAGAWHAIRKHAFNVSPHSPRIWNT